MVGPHQTVRMYRLTKTIPIIPCPEDTTSQGMVQASLAQWAAHQTGDQEVSIQSLLGLVTYFCGD